MFKNYLTYQFAQSFDRACRHAAVSEPVREKLIHSSTRMLDHFKRALECEDRKQTVSLLFVALLCLRDCMETLETFGIRVQEIEVPFQILERRLEQLLGSRDSNLAENGRYSRRDSSSDSPGGHPRPGKTPLPE